MSEILLKFLVSKKKKLSYERVIFLKNTFVNIFDFVNESQSLIRKVKAAKKKVCCWISKVSTASFHHLIAVFINYICLCVARVFFLFQGSFSKHIYLSIFEFIFPALFLEKKNDSGGKCPDCAYSWIKFSIQSVILRVSRRRNSDIFPCRDFLSWLFNEIFIEVPLFYETFPFLKISWLCACNSDKFIALRKSCAFISMKTNSKLNVALFLKVDYLVSFFTNSAQTPCYCFSRKKNYCFFDTPWDLIYETLWLYDFLHELY